MNRPIVVVRAGERLYGFLVRDVIETMRPLPCEPLPDVPAFVRGVSIIRGEPTPVVDLAALLGDQPGHVARLVTLRTERGRAVAVGVEAVVGLRDAAALPAETLPPLLQDAGTTLIDTLTRLDGALLTMLRAAYLLPPDLAARVSEPQL